MTAILFDTLKLAKRLESAGQTPDQAAGIAEALSDAITGTVATKADLEALELRMDARFAGIDARLAQLDAKIDRVEARLEAKIAQLDAKIDRMVVRLGVIVVAAMSALLLADKFLTNFHP